MVNEALCKVLCHNLCCLIMSTYELGIVAKFWGEAEAEELTDAVDDLIPSDLVADVFAWM